MKRKDDLSNGRTPNPGIPDRAVPAAGGGVAGPALERREFFKLAAGGALAVLAMASCDNGVTNPGDPNAQRTFTSTSDNGHAHTITIQRAEVQNPPAAGITRQTSSNTGHTHQFSMTQAELMTVNGGGNVVVVTSVVDLHSHTFTITKWF
jgi:hypothetical protein